MKETYQDMYKKLDYGPIATARGLTAARHVEILFKPCRVLCVGAGNAYEAVNLVKRGFDVTVIDYVTPKFGKFKRFTGKAQELPFEDNSFNLLMCCECLEHIPENEVINALKEFKRVTTYFYFTIDDADDPPYHSHVCVKEPEWWIKQFDRVGLTGKMFKPARYATKIGENIYTTVYKDMHGFNIYGNKILPEQV